MDVTVVKQAKHLILVLYNLVIHCDLIFKTMNTRRINVLLTANNVQGTMGNVRHDVKDTLLDIPLLTKRLEKN